MDIIQKSIQYGTMRLGLVVAGLLAAGCAHTRHRGTHRRTRTSHVKAQLIELVEGLLNVFRGRALKHDVAGLAVKCDQTGAMFLPDIAHVTQHLGVIVHARRRHDAKGVKLGAILVNALAAFVLQLGKARDNTAAIAKHANRTALPVPFSGSVRGFELSKQVDDVILVSCQRFQAGHKTGPWAILELVKVWGIMHLLSHNLPFSRIAQGLLLAIDSMTRQSRGLRAIRVPRLNHTAFNPAARLIY